MISLNILHLYLIKLCCQNRKGQNEASEPRFSKPKNKIKKSDKKTIKKQPQALETKKTMEKPKYISKCLRETINKQRHDIIKSFEEKVYTNHGGSLDYYTKGNETLLLMI